MAFQNIREQRMHRISFVSIFSGMMLVLRVSLSILGMAHFIGSVGTVEG